MSGGHNAFKDNFNVSGQMPSDSEMKKLPSNVFIFYTFLENLRFLYGVSQRQIQICFLKDCLISGVASISRSPLNNAVTSRLFVHAVE